MAIGDTATTLALAKFVVRQLGLIPARLVVTDNPPEEHREAIRAQFRTLDHDVSVEVDFADDSFTIHQLVRDADLGSTWERDLAKQLRGFVLEVGFPASYEVVLSRAYVGYRGALALIERIYTTTIGRSA